MQRADALIRLPLAGRGCGDGRGEGPRQREPVVSAGLGGRLLRVALCQHDRLPPRPDQPPPDVCERSGGGLAVVHVLHRPPEAQGARRDAADAPGGREQLPSNTGNLG